MSRSENIAAASLGRRKRGDTEPDIFERYHGSEIVHEFTLLTDSVVFRVSP
jgi:hypothetical protein